MHILLLVTAASDLLVHKILLNSVLLSPIVSGGLRPKPPGQTPIGHNPLVCCHAAKDGVMTKGVVSGGVDLPSSPAYNVEPVTNTSPSFCANNG